MSKTESSQRLAGRDAAGKPKFRAASKRDGIRIADLESRDNTEVVIHFRYRKFPQRRKVPGVPHIDDATLKKTETLNDLFSLIKQDLSGQTLKETFNVDLPDDVREVEVCVNPSLQTWYYKHDLVSEGDLEIWKMEEEAGNTIFKPVITIILDDRKIDLVVPGSDPEPMF